METENILAMLYGQMNDQQQLRFKQAIVTQTIHYVSQRLPLADQDQGERSFIALAHQWIAQPTTEHAEQAAAASSDKEYFLAPAQAAAAATGYEAIPYALLAAGEFQHVEAKQWQKAAAWDILADRKLPPIEEFED
jgi:hypothetical protein